MSDRKSDLSDVEKGLKIDRGLTPWEVNFLENLERYLTKHETLTKTQREKLDQILTEKE